MSWLKLVPLIASPHFSYPSGESLQPSTATALRLVLSRFAGGSPFAEAPEDTSLETYEKSALADQRIELLAYPVS